MNHQIFHDPNLNAALEHFLQIVEKLLNKHAPYKYVKHFDLTSQHLKSQFDFKPLVTPGLANSIKIKKNFTKVSARKKIHTKKKIMKVVSNLISTLLGRQKVLTKSPDSKYEKQIR